MKVLNVYRSTPDDITKKLVEVVSEGTEASSFDLNNASPDYSKLVDMIFEADKTYTWW
jgi:hypothetical protein